MKSTQIEITEKKLNCFVKFYANAPDGTKNKYLVYKVYDLSHALDLLMKFQKNEWYIKSAFFEDETGKNKKLPNLPV
jgi:hypothetical protein